MPDSTTDTVVQNPCDCCGAVGTELWHNEQYGGALCESCDQDYPEMYLCTTCDSEWNSEDEAYDCCRHTCGDCGAEHRYADDAEMCCWPSCPNCGERHSDDYDAQRCCEPEGFTGDLPHLPEVDAYSVTVPVIEGRPARLCSLEQELVAGGGVVARLLYEEGVCAYDRILGYHSSSASSRPGTVHVEEDGSLPHTGGEVVYDRFNLSLDEQASTMSRILTRIRQLRDSGSGSNRPVRTGFAAGIHVHIAAKAVDGTMMTPDGVAALYELWCHAEDMLYALSAAGWNRHRQPSDHGGYCKPVPKGTGKCHTS